MHSYSIIFPLLTISLLNGAPVHSNSPHSPYTQLKVLAEDVNSIKETLEKMKSGEEVSEVLSNENKQLISRIEQLESENKNLQNQLMDLKNVYEKQMQDLLALSKDFKEFRSQEKVLNSDTEFVAVKKDISKIRETLNATQDKIGKVENGGSREVKIFQEQLQKMKSEFLGFCQTTNQKLQDFAEQMKSNLMQVAHNSFVKHIISSGESLASIARLYRTTPDKILDANHLQDTRGLHVGDSILVPQEAL